MTAHVVHVSQPVEAGVARVVLDLMLDQRSAGWRVTLASPEGWLAEQARAHDLPWSAWSATRQPGPAALAEARALGRVLQARDPDVVHLHSSKAGLAGRLALRGRRPTVFQPHAWSFAAATGPQARAAAVWERTAVRWTTLRLACSPEEEAEAHARGIGGRARVVLNGVDLTRYPVADPVRRAAARTRLGVTDATPLAVCVGRLSHQKGQDVALQAWPVVRQRVPGAVLCLIGDGPDRARLKHLAGEGVLLLGPRDDVPDLLPAADVALLPSRWEGLALALLEAMSTGLPVVATDVAGSRSTLTGGAAPAGGAVVSVENPAALAGAVAHRLGDAARARAEGQAGRARVEQQHDLRRTTAQVRLAYDSLLAG